jgi:hypothetical protein
VREERRGWRATVSEGTWKTSLSIPRQYEQPADAAFGGDGDCGNV